MRQSEIDPKDYKYFIETPDASFSVERNQAIINQTIAQTDKFFASLSQLSADTEDRLDILNSYGRYRFNQGHKPFKEYAGDKLYARLVGEKILNRVKVMQSADRFAQMQAIQNKRILV